MNLNAKNLKHLLITFKLGLERSKPLNFISYPMNVDHIEEKLKFLIKNDALTTVHNWSIGIHF